MEIDPEIVEYAFNNFNNFYTSMKGFPLVNAYCTLCNFYNYEKYKPKIRELIRDLEPKILKSFNQQRYVNDVFVVAYCAYLCSAKLDQIELSNSILNILEKITNEDKFLCQSGMATILFLEQLEKSNPISQKILKQILVKQDLRNNPSLSTNSIKQALINSNSECFLTNGLIISWFEKNIKQMEINDLTLFLHLFNQKKLRHVLTKSETIVKELKQKFLSSKHLNNYLMIEYRKNTLMDEQLLQSFESFVLKQIKKRELTLSQIIDNFYNITRLRRADENLIEAIKAVSDSRYDKISFSDYVKLINSCLHQQVDDFTMEKILNTFIDKINANKFDIIKETFQQKKLFYMCLRQISNTNKNIKINYPSIQEFYNEIQMQLNNENQKYNSQKLINEIEDNSEDLYQTIAEDTPYELQISQILQELNISFSREHIIDFFKIDYFLPDRNICIEINGELHYFNDQPTPPTFQKIKYLESLNYKVITIRGQEWKNLQSKESQEEYLKNLLSQ